MPNDDALGRFSPEQVPTAAASSGGGREVNPLAMAADLLELVGHRADLSYLQCRELYSASAALWRERAGLAMTTRWPASEPVFGWIDRVYPNAELPNAEAGPAGTEPDPMQGDPAALLLGPEPGVMAGHLGELAARRPDLSDWQRHELYLAARAHLHHGYGRDRRPPSRGSIFAWIDLITPARSRPSPPATPRPAGRPKGSGYIAGRGVVVAAYQAVLELPDRNPAATPSVEVVAKKLDVSRRTLVRFLDSEGIPWPPK